MGALRQGAISGRYVRIVVSVLAGCVLFGTVQVASASADSVPLATQIANDPVSLSAEQFREDLFVAGDVARLSDPANTEDLVLERVLQQLYAANPGLSPQDATGAITSLETATTLPAAATALSTGANARIEATLIALQQTQPAGIVAPALAVIANDALKEAAQGPAGDVNEAVASGDTSDSLESTGSFAPQTVLEQSAALAHANSSFANARDTLWEGASGESITASASDLLANATALKDNQDVAAIAALRDATGALNTTAGQIVGGAQAPAPHTVGAVIDNLQSVETSTFSTVDSVAAGGPIQSADEAAATLAQVSYDQTAATLGDATLSSLEGSSSYADAQKYSEEAVTTVAAVGKVIDAGEQFSAGKLTGALLTGNVAQAALSLMPVVADLFGLGSSGPSPDEIILQQVQALSQQVSDFQSQVNQQFAAVDKGLDSVLTGVSGLSNQLDKLAAQVNAAQLSISDAEHDITSEYGALEQLQGSVVSVEANIYQALANEDNSELLGNINHYIGYQADNGAPMSAGDFATAASYFYSFATLNATSTPQLWDAGTGYGPGGVFAQLDPFGWDPPVSNPGTINTDVLQENIDYLNQFPSEHQWSTALAATQTLANPNSWALAARAYSQLLLENPQYVTSHYRAQLADLEAEGNQIDAMIQGVSTADTTTGTHNTLLNDLLCYYGSIATGATIDGAGDPCDPHTLVASATTNTQDALDAIKTAQTQILSRQQGADGANNPTPGYPLQQATGQPLDPWGGASQSSDLGPLWSTFTNQTTPECGPFQSGFAGPASGVPQGWGNIDPTPADVNPQAAQVPDQYQLADRLGLGKLSVCWTADNFGEYFFWTFTPSVTLPGDGSKQPIIAQVQIAGPNFSPSCSSGGMCGISDLNEVIAAWNSNPHTVLSRSGPLAWLGAPNLAGLPFTTQPDTLYSTGWAQYGTNGDGCTSAQTPVAGCYYTFNQTDAAVSAAVQAALVKQQQYVYTQLLTGSQPGGNVSSGALHDSLVQLDGAQQLITDYVELGMSTQLSEDPTLSSFIKGNAPLYSGTSDNAASIQAALTQAASESDPPATDVVTSVIAPALSTGAGGPDDLESALTADIFTRTSSTKAQETIAADARRTSPADAPRTSAPAAQPTSPTNAEQADPFVDSVNDRLVLTGLALSHGPSPSITSPAPGDQLDAPVTVAGTALDGAADQPTITVSLYPGTNTSGTPAQTVTATESAGKWSVPAGCGLPSGVYTTQAAQSDINGNTGHSSAVTFTLNAPAVLPPSCNANNGSGATSAAGGGATSAGAGGNATPTPAVTGGAPKPAEALLKLLRAKLLASSFTAKKGTKLTFALSRTGRLIATVTTTTKGHKHGRKCARSGHGRACTMTTTVKRITLSGRSGPNTVVFGRGMRKGSYTLTLTPSSAGRSASSIVLHFKVH